MCVTFYHLPCSDEIDGLSASNSAPSLSASGANLRQQLVSKLANKKPDEENKPPRVIEVKLSVTETDFVVVEDVRSLDSSAVVLKGTVVLKFCFIPNKEMIVKCSMEGLELFSCNLSNEDESALSILDPVSISLELRPPEKNKADQQSTKLTVPSPPETVISQVFVVSSTFV